MSNKCESDVTIALTILIKFLGLAVLMQERLSDLHTLACLTYADAQRPHGVDDVGIFDD